MNGNEETTRKKIQNLKIQFPENYLNWGLNKGRGM